MNEKQAENVVAAIEELADLRAQYHTAPDVASKREIVDLIAEQRRTLIDAFMADSQ